jgi:hypothetical protein
VAQVLVLGLQMLDAPLHVDDLVGEVDDVHVRSP